MGEEEEEAIGGRAMREEEHRHEAESRKAGSWTGLMAHALKGPRFNVQDEKA